MGLDITAYSKLKQIDCVFDADSEPIDPVTRHPIPGNYFRAYVNPDFSGREGKIQHHAVYRFDQEFCFHAGSYGGYNQWRELLAAFAEYPKIETGRYGDTKEQHHDAAAFSVASGPFWELIVFSDCEGVMGSETCAKLAADFKTFETQAETYSDEYWREKYRDWKHAFEIGADDGAVDFH